MQSSYEHFVPTWHVQRQDQFNWNFIKQAIKAVNISTVCVDKKDNEYNQN
jgi:hypothetical protein